MIPADRAFTECIKGVIAFQNTQTVCLLATVRKQRLASFGCFFFFSSSLWQNFWFKANHWCRLTPSLCSVASLCSSRLHPWPHLSSWQGETFPIRENKSLPFSREVSKSHTVKVRSGIMNWKMSLIYYSLFKMLDFPASGTRMIFTFFPVQAWSAKSS